jgi:hypothetical protein
MQQIRSPTAPKTVIRQLQDTNLDWAALQAAVGRSWHLLPIREVQVQQENLNF